MKYVIGAMIVAFSTLVFVMPCASGLDCTLTLGFWKTHEDWPVTSLVLGRNVYDQDELRAILWAPVRRNGLVQLAQQLIAVKLNVEAGANPTDVLQAVIAADEFIGARRIPPIGSASAPPSQTSGMVETLDQYNQGIIGPGHCDAVSNDVSSWGEIKARYR